MCAHRGALVRMCWVRGRFLLSSSFAVHLVCLFVFWYKVCHWPRSSLFQIDRLHSELRLYPTLTQLWGHRSSHHSWSPTQVLLPVQQALSPLSHLPSSGSFSPHWATSPAQEAKVSGDIKSGCIGRVCIQSLIQGRPWQLLNSSQSLAWATIKLLRNDKRWKGWRETEALCAFDVNGTATLETSVRLLKC